MSPVSNRDSGIETAGYCSSSSQNPSVANQLIEFNPSAPRLETVAAAAAAPSAATCSKEHDEKKKALAGLLEEETAAGRSLVLNEATDQQVCARLCFLMKAQLVKAHEEVSRY